MATPTQPSSSLPPAMEDGEYPNWAELPPELTSSILQRLGVIEILENAQKVCTSWHRICKDPSMWRKIDMYRNFVYLRSIKYNLETMCRHAVDRSQGGLLEIDISGFVTDPLLTYIAASSSNLRSFKLGMCNPITNEGLVEAVVKLPLLEDLKVSFCEFSEESLKVIGQSCPNLRTLKLDHRVPPDHLIGCDDDALGIAETMPGLRHLQLCGNRLSNVGLKAILENCPNLEHLDLRQCYNLEICKDLEKRCSERIKVVRLPNASTLAYLFDPRFIDLESFEDDDYHSEFDDLYWEGFYL